MRGCLRFFRLFFLGAVFLLPLSLSFLLHVTVMGPLREERSVEVTLERIHARSAGDLEALFAAVDYAWPPTSAVPRLALKRLPRGLDDVPVEMKKALFLRTVLPLILAENKRVSNQRELLIDLFRSGELPPGSRGHRLVLRIALAYGIEGDLNSVEARNSLLQRVDTVPVALALAQAAKESAWGTSRFARDGNSLFGQWTWVRGQGLVPFRRAPGKGHLVRHFHDLREAVRSYVHNINVGHAYGQFRSVREGMRKSGVPLDPMILAAGLSRYSERGAAYVREIRSLMRNNRLPEISGESVLQ